MTLTNNVAEGWNSIWNKNSIINGTLWYSIDHMRKEDSTMTAEWCKDLTNRNQNSPTIDKTRGGRKNLQSPTEDSMQDIVNIEGVTSNVSKTVI